MKLMVFGCQGQNCLFEDQIGGFYNVLDLVGIITNLRVSL